MARIRPRGAREVLECIGLSILGAIIALVILYLIFALPPHP